MVMACYVPCIRQFCHSVNEYLDVAAASFCDTGSETQKRGAGRRHLLPRRAELSGEVFLIPGRLINLHDACAVFFYLLQPNDKGQRCVAQVAIDLRTGVDSACFLSNFSFLPASACNPARLGFL